nr:hypothetical protein [Tanacetum cinerariifolium]
MTSWYKNNNQSGQFGNQRTMNVAGARENEVPTADTCTDSEPLKQEQNDTGYNVFANYLQHSEQSESISNTCIVEKDDSNVIPDSSDMCDDVIQNDQNDIESNDERKPAPFLDSLKRRYFSKTKSVPKTNESEGLSKPVTAQTLPQTARQVVKDCAKFQKISQKPGKFNTRIKA